MKSMFISALMVFSMNAMADQCQLISSEEAKRAALLLQKNAVITEFCEPCNDKVRKETVVKQLKVESVVLGNQFYSEIKINGRSVDLAYLFIQVAPDRSVNVARAIGCSTLDESSVSSVL